MNEERDTKPGLTPAQQTLNDLWEEHLRDEFTTQDTNATLQTMVPDAYVNHIPVLTGGVGHEQLREFYSRHFIPKMPPDTEIVPISRTIGAERLVDEMIFRFTHTIEMDWMLPGIAPTGKRVECALVVIVHFRDGKLSNEHIYWDQASVLVQLGFLDAAKLPVAGLETARKLADPSLPSNHLIERSPEVVGPRGGGDHHQENCHDQGVPVFRNECDDVPAITRGQVSQYHVSGDAAKGERQQKFFYGILHGACREQKWNHGHRRRQEGRDGNRTEAPAFKNVANFVHFPAREPAFQGCLAALASEPVGEKAAQHRTNCGHQGVVKPQRLMAGGKENGCHIHDAGKRNGGVVQEAEGNQPQAAEVKQPMPHALQQSGKRDRNQLVAGQQEKSVRRATFRMGTSEHV